MGLTEQEVAATRIFTAYCDEMNQRGLLSRSFPAQVWQCGPKVQRYFLDAGASCVDYGVDPEEYIRVAFSKVLQNQRYITPKDIVSAKKVVEAMLHQQKVGLRVNQEWAHMVKSIRLRVMQMVPKTYADEIDILMDPMQPFTGWFRVLYPEDIYECLFQVYGTLAYSELSADRKLRAFLRGQRKNSVEKLERLTAGFGDAILEGAYDG